MMDAPRHWIQSCNFSRFLSAVVMSTVVMLGLTGGAAVCQSAFPPEVPGSDERVYEMTKESAVDIYITGPTAKPNVLSRICGAGFILTDSGYVITCSHVAEPDGIRTVGFHDTTSLDEELPYRVVARHDGMDVAVIKIKSDRKFKPARLGKSSNLTLGEPIIVIGNPNGKRHAIATGKVTNLAANWGYQWGYGGTWHHDFIASDANATHGHSGGPMFNRRGEVVGMFSGNMTGPGGSTSFAIPIDKIIKRLPEILDVEGPDGFVIGMKVLPLDQGKVIGMDKGSPAEAAGIKLGDVVTAIGKVPVNLGLDFYHGLLDFGAGDTITLKLTRDDVPYEAVVKLGAPPMAPAEQIASDQLRPGIARQYYEGSWNQLPDFSTLKPLASDVAETFNIDPHRGKDKFALRFAGYVNVPTDGTYTFGAASDDGSAIYIGNSLVVDNDLLHGPVGVRGDIRLKAGLHPITVEFFEFIGGDVLDVRYRGPGIEWQPVPASALFHKAK